MVQRKTSHERFGQEHEEMMKRSRPSRLLQSTTPEKYNIAKFTGGSPNYMKGTSSSEARRQRQGVQDASDKKNQRGKSLDSCSEDMKQSNSRSSGRTLSFKRSYRNGRFGDVNAHRATCSSFLKDSKLPEYMVLTSPGFLKLCPYKYCSLHAHLHLQFPPLKSFISARRHSMKSQTSKRMSGDDDCCVDIFVDEKLGDRSIQEVYTRVIDYEAENTDTECEEAKEKDEGEDIECKKDDLETLADTESCGSEDGNIAMMIDNQKGIKVFYPREPNYLPVVEEPTHERVELKHQDMDERKKAEEWMIDYALQQTVRKLAPQRKEKVAMLVEAFETIFPRESSPLFTYGRHLQACN